MIGCTELRGANAALLFGDDGPMLAPFYGIASTEIYGESPRAPDRDRRTTSRRPRC